MKTHAKITAAMQQAKAATTTPVKSSTPAKAPEARAASSTPVKAPQTPETQTPDRAAAYLNGYDLPGPSSPNRFNRYPSWCTEVDPIQPAKPAKYDPVKYFTFS